MDIDKLEMFLQKLEQFSQKEADSAYIYFKEQWPQFSKDERKILSGVVGGIALRVCEGNASLRTKLNWMAIANYSEKPVIEGKVIEDDDDDIFPGLVLSSEINGNQITKIFRDLKTKGIITSSYDLIAEAISIIFPIEYGTAYNDLTEEKRLQKVLSLLP